MALLTFDRVAHVSPFWPIVYHFGEQAGRSSERGRAASGKGHGAAAEEEAAAAAAAEEAAAAAAEQEAKARGVSVARARIEPPTRSAAAAEVVP